MRDGYIARWQGVEFEASPAPNGTIRIYSPTPRDGFVEVAPGRYCRVMMPSELEDFGCVRTVCTWRGEPFVVIGKHQEWLRLEYLGGKAPVAEQLGLERFDVGVYQAWAPRAEVTDLREQRLPG